jgi:hemerythrin-like domain-containing protein
VDAIQLIRREHRNIEGLFRTFERAADVEQRRRTAREIVRELSLHSGIEEQILYPALRNAGFQSEVLDALEEHHAAKVTLAELDAMPASRERFVPKMKVLIANVRLHIEEEERELLPALERALEAGELQELGAALETVRRVAPTRPHPTAPDAPPANIVTSAAAGIVDRGRDAIRGGFEMLRVLAGRTAESGIRIARELAARGQQQAWRAGAEMRESGREGIAQARELGSEVVSELDERREQGRRALQETGREVASAMNQRPQRRSGRRTKAQRQGAKRRGGGVRQGSPRRGSSSEAQLH